jgi:hypothetical protein
MVAPALSDVVPALRIKPYRYPPQRGNTLMVRAPTRFFDQVLWPEFCELDRTLQGYLRGATLRVIRENVYPEQ